MIKIISPSAAYVPSLRRIIDGGFMHLMGSRRLANFATDAEFIQVLTVRDSQNPGQRMLPNGEVVSDPPETYFWLVDEAAQELLATASIRHHLTPTLIKQGGHIGYATVPSAWGKGYALQLLQHALRFARAECGLTRALITIDESNSASRRVTEKAGGALWDVIDHPFKPGIPHCRYWVATQ